MTTTTTTIRLSGLAAIAYAELRGATLSKHNDPTEDARDGLSAAEAREVAAQDPSLIYLDAQVRISAEGHEVLAAFTHPLAEIAEDVSALVLGDHTPASLLEHCLSDDDESVNDGWRAYVTDLEIALGL